MRRKLPGHILSGLVTSRDMKRRVVNGCREQSLGMSFSLVLSVLMYLRRRKEDGKEGKRQGVLSKNRAPWGGVLKRKDRDVRGRYVARDGMTETGPNQI